MKANYKIELLCPGSRCPKCERLINNIDLIFKELKLDYDFRKITAIDEMLNYHTAILPSLFVNGKLLFVGEPDFDTLKKGLLELVKRHKKNGTE